MNIVQSANKRREEEKHKAEQQRRLDFQIKQELLNIRLAIFQITKDLPRAIAAWDIIKDIDFPKITAYANALYVYLDKDCKIPRRDDSCEKPIDKYNLPTVKELEEVVNYLSLDLNQ